MNDQNLWLKLKKYNGFALNTVNNVTFTLEL